MKNLESLALVCAAVAAICWTAPGARAGECQVFCNGTMSGSGPYASAQACLDDMCLRDVIPCGCLSTTDCFFDGVSIMPTPVCGDGQRQGTEECDPGPNPYGEEDCSCPDACLADCTCPAVVVAGGFTYQGELLDGGIPVNDDCDFEFTLWDAEIDGNQIGPALAPTVFLVEGRFTVTLDFGDDPFTGAPRWLEIQTCCPTGCAPVSLVPLDPRQALTAAPYALALPGLRTTPGGDIYHPGAPRNVIGGSNNTVEPGVSSATISGGSVNVASATSATVGGGTGNTASGEYSTVGGGNRNTASGKKSTVGGGQLNLAGGRYSFAAGYRAKVRDNDPASPYYSGDYNGDQGTFAWADSNNTDFASTGPDQFLIRAAGGVGIGTNAPDPGSALTVAGDIAIPWGGRIQTTNTTHSARTIMNSGWRTSAGDYLDLYVPGQGQADDPRLTITEFGRVGIGVTNPAASLHVGTGEVRLPGGTAGAGDTTHFNYSGDGRNYIRGETIMADTGGNVGIGRTPTTYKLEVEGRAGKTVGGSAWVVISDRRLKTGIEDVENALERLDKVHLVSFDYTDEYKAQHPEAEDRRHYNVIAQEYAEVFPDHVKPMKGLLPDGGDALSVDIHPLTIYSAAAIQELHALVQAQQTEIDALRLRLDAVESAGSRTRTAAEGGAK